MNYTILLVLVFYAASFALAGICIGISYENIRMNTEITKKLTSNSLIRVGGELYSIQKIKGVELNDSTIRTIEYSIK